MTTLMPELDASSTLLAEWRTWLHGDPRYSEPAVPPPRCLERHRHHLQTLIDHQQQAAQESADV